VQARLLLYYNNAALLLCSKIVSYKRLLNDISMRVEHDDEETN
jgi:hypothetical protein